MTTSIYFNISSLDSKIKNLMSNGFALVEEKGNHPSATYTNEYVYKCGRGYYNGWMCTLYTNKDSGHCSLHYGVNKWNPLESSNNSKPLIP